MVNNNATSGKPHVIVYTDGACSGNPGRGGYAAILKYNNHYKELSGGYRLTTNNRMELMAVIKALQALKRPCRVTLYSDSQYVVNAFRKGWIYQWRANNWCRGRNHKPVPNADLWQQLLDLVSRHEVEWQWIEGHSGNPMNELCDRLAVAAAKANDLEVDTVYESQYANQKPGDHATGNNQFED